MKSGCKSSAGIWPRVIAAAMLAGSYGVAAAEPAISNDAAVAKVFAGGSFSTFGPLIPEEDGSLSPDVLHLEQDAYWLTNVSARFGMNEWTVRLFVDNVFDEEADLWRNYEDAFSLVPRALHRARC